MKICHMTNGHDSYDARIFNKECRSLAKAGHDVYLVGLDGINEVIDGVKIRSIILDGIQQRHIRLIKAPYLIYKKALMIDADIYHLHDISLIPFGLMLKRRGKKVIFDSHEDYPADFLTKEWLPKILRKPISRIYASYEKYAIAKFDAIISITPHVVERLKKSNKNTYLVTNYPIISDALQLDACEKKNMVCFVGVLCDESLQKNIIKAFGSIKNARYLLAGPSEKAYLEDLKRMPQWERVDYVGEIKFSEAKKLISSSLAGLALIDYLPNSGNKIGTLGNTKLFSYMEAGVPVICTDFILWKEIVDEYNCGICINPNNIDEIVKSINFIIDNPEKSIQMGKNARRAIEEKFNWKTQEICLLKCYNNI